MVLFGQKGLYSVKIGCIRENWLYTGRAVVLGERWLYSLKNVVFE